MYFTYSETLGRALWRNSKKYTADLILLTKSKKIGTKKKICAKYLGTKYICKY